ncbi:hypothetical protein V6N11_074020 [Hibiscus sabdariffa]|uniref:apyrase n=1 Tax=Hibiscus sabdariffa TaxID=183260 RepID=A0ABR2P5C7_9ROSI
MKSPVKTAVGDVLISFMWAFVSSSFGLLTYLIASAAGVQTVAWAPLVIITLVFFVFISIFNIIGAVLGGASFDPTATAAFYAAGVSDDTLISMALRLPAQAAGAVGGTLAIMEAIPEQYKHLIGGPSLKVDAHTGAIAEGVLTFLIAFAVLLIILRGPQSSIFKTWLIAIVVVTLVTFGSAYTGPSMNPAFAFGWAYVYKQHNTWDHFYVYWICPFIGTILAAWVFRLFFSPPPAKVKFLINSKIPKFRNLEDLEPLPVSTGNGQIRYRTPSSAELLESGSNGGPVSPDGNDTDDHPEKMIKRSMARHESISDKIHKYRGVLLVISIPIVLITFVLYVLPGKSASDAAVLEEIELNSRRVGNSRGNRNYAVIFDAGSSGSRVHVYCFDHNLDLVPIGSDLELFEQLKPGLSYYAKDPQAAANSLSSLLDKAESVVPMDLRSKTPVRVGATAGLRALGGNTSDKILQSVRELLKSRSTLKSEANGVKILDGSQEGSYEWVTINYLLGNLGRTYRDTVGVVDLGGGSVQMAYAISENAASRAPSAPAGQDSYVNEMYLKGSKYHLYVHSYLHYGLLAARAEILKVSEDSGNPCILEGFDGTYQYGGEEYKASAPSSGSSMEECRRLTLKALKVNDSCTHMKCTFGGIWNGGGGDGQKNLFVASFFFDRAAEAGFIKASDPVAKVQPHSFADAAKRACQTKYADAKTTYGDLGENNLPYICMDLVYEYTLLVDGFGLDPYQDIRLVVPLKLYHHEVKISERSTIACSDSRLDFLVGIIGREKRFI